LTSYFNRPIIRLYGCSLSPSVNNMEGFMKLIAKVFFVFLFLSLLIIRPTPSYAWHDGWHGRGYVGVNLGVWPGYYDGYAYPYYAPYYADPYYPSYAVVAASSYQPVVINGFTYYVNNGVYYIYTQYGYQAVATPAGASAPVIQAAPVTATVMAVSPVSASIDSDDSFTINVPNDKGGYSAVLLKRSGKGFIGPQGEFYSEFPKVSQLKLMYGK